MTLTDLFKRLGAPLKNQRWSWGAVRDDGVVVLRVWYDKLQRMDGALFVQVQDADKRKSRLDNPGSNERDRHIQMLREGTPCLLIMCVAKDPEAGSRAIKSFNKNSIWRGGDLKDMEGDISIELKEKIESQIEFKSLEG